MNQQVEDVLKTMTASRILSAVLAEVKTVSISVNSFIEYTNVDKELMISYDDATNCFEFKLREKVAEDEQSTEE
jgi:hypothetical protein